MAEPTAPPISDALAWALPFLRRYARALTGSQKLGDEWVRLSAEVALRQPELIAEAKGTKLGLFALFHRLRQPFGNLDASDNKDTVQGRLKESLTELAPLQRKVLLLSVLEGFSIHDVAHILDVDANTVSRAFEDARRELQRVAGIRVLVIEDEPIIALDVAEIVRNSGHEVVGIAATEKTAVELAKRHAPHLVLADVQLRGVDSGIAAVSEIMNSMSIPVIFVTGYPERLLTGEKVEPAFIISKPFNPDVLRTAIAQALDTVTI
ncbi:MAG: response regulator [Reyranellaceae bacterium]